MHDYVNWKDARTRRELPGMDEATARQLWLDTRWKWMKGDQIQDQNIATLIFDYFVNRGNSAILGIAEVLLAIYKRPKFNYIQKQIAPKVMYRDAIAWDHPEPTGKMYILSDLAIQLINNTQTQSMLFVLIKKARIKTEKGDRTRFKAFNYGDIKTQSEYEYIQDSLKEAAAKSKKKHLWQINGYSRKQIKENK